jgi:penicillin-insensitive murein endopeptidase
MCSRSRSKRFCFAAVLCIQLAVCGGCGAGSATTESNAHRTEPVISENTLPSEHAEPSLVPEASEVEPLTTPVAEPQASGGLAASPLLVSASLSTSIGGPSNGSIRGAVPLPEAGPGFRSNALRPNVTAYFGTVELVSALVQAAAAVHEELPGSEVVINDLGFAEGGPIPHHGSHQAGRDVDVLFYYLDHDGQPWPAKGVPIDLRGRGWDFGDLSDPRDDVRVRIDLPRTWRFIAALIEHDLAAEEPLLQRMFIAELVRTLLLGQAERVRAPSHVRERFEALTCQPSHPHDDHVHLRFFCSAEDLREGCADSPPLYPWRREQLRAVGIEPVFATRAPRRERAPTVTRRQAQQAAGRIHSRVAAFLAERALWSAAQHPGRPYCR